jgi:hypothetical protein
MISKKVVLRFPPVSSNSQSSTVLVKDFDLVVNILRADINPRKEGSLVIELTGQPEYYNDGIKFMENLGVNVRAPEPNRGLG